MLPVLYKWLLYHLAVLDNLHGGREMPNHFILKLKAPGTAAGISFWCSLPTIAPFYSLSSSDEPVMPLGQKEMVHLCFVPQQAPEQPWSHVRISASRTSISAMAKDSNTGVISAMFVKPCDFAEAAPCWFQNSLKVNGSEISLPCNYYITHGDWVSSLRFHGFMTLISICLCT